MCGWPEGVAGIGDRRRRASSRSPHRQAGPARGTTSRLHAAVGHMLGRGFAFSGFVTLLALDFIVYS